MKNLDYLSSRDFTGWHWLIYTSIFQISEWLSMVLILCSLNVCIGSSNAVAIWNCYSDFCITYHKRHYCCLSFSPSHCSSGRASHHVMQTLKHLTSGPWWWRPFSSHQFMLVSFPLLWQNAWRKHLKRSKGLLYLMVSEFAVHNCLVLLPQACGKLETPWQEAYDPQRWSHCSGQEAKKGERV